MENDDKTELTLQGFKEWFPIGASLAALMVSAFAAYANITTRLSLLETAYTGTTLPRLEQVETRTSSVVDAISNIRNEVNILNQRVTTIEQEMKENASR